LNLKNKQNTGWIKVSNHKTNISSQIWNLPTYRYLRCNFKFTRHTVQRTQCQLLHVKIWVKQHCFYSRFYFEVILNCVTKSKTNHWTYRQTAQRNDDGTAAADKTIYLRPLRLADETYTKRLQHFGILQCQHSREKHVRAKIFLSDMFQLLIEKFSTTVSDTWINKFTNIINYVTETDTVYRVSVITRYHDVTTNKI